jgi:hypothetical protein
VTEDYVHRTAVTTLAGRIRTLRTGNAWRVAGPCGGCSDGQGFLSSLEKSIFPACSGYLKSRHDDILIGAAGFIEYPTNVATLEKLLQEEYAREGAASAS